MFARKKKYFFIIENTKDIDLSNIKKKNKFVIIYRNLESKESISKLINFRRLTHLLFRRLPSFSNPYKHPSTYLIFYLDPPDISHLQ